MRPERACAETVSCVVVYARVYCILMYDVYVYTYFAVCICKLCVVCCIVRIVYVIHAVYSATEGITLMMYTSICHKLQTIYVILYI